MSPPIGRRPSLSGYGSAFSLAFVLLVPARAAFGRGRRDSRPSGARALDWVVTGRPSR